MTWDVAGIFAICSMVVFAVFFVLVQKVYLSGGLVGLALLGGCFLVFCILTYLFHYLGNKYHLRGD